MSDIVSDIVTSVEAVLLSLDSPDAQSPALPDSPEASMLYVEQLIQKTILNVLQGCIQLGEPSRLGQSARKAPIPRRALQQHSPQIGINTLVFRS